MRKLLLFTILAIITLGLIVEADYYLSKHWPAIEGGVNLEGRKIGLRAQADQSLPMIAWLPNGSFAPVNAAGQRWIYIELNSQQYAIPKKLFSSGYSQLYDKWVVPTQDYQHYHSLLTSKISWIHGVLTVSLCGLLWLIRRQHRSPQKAQTLPPQHTTPQPTQKPTEPSAPEQPPTQEEIKQRCIKETLESATFLQALNVEYHGRIEEMEIAAKQLQSEFESKKKSAKVLGVDLDSSKLPILVKGRLFEVFAAKQWHNDPRIKIQSWTPDKGIDDGIYVESNGHPDFLLNINTPQESLAMVIECKYRSSYPPQKRVSWVKYYQYKRYKEYETNTGKTVYILLGIDGTPDNPDQLYLAPLSYFKDVSDYDGRPNFKNWCADLSDIAAFNISRTELAEKAYVTIQR